jgi:hypothetical protein
VRREIRLILGMLLLTPVMMVLEMRIFRATKRSHRLQVDGTFEQRKKAHDRGECPKSLGGYMCKSMVECGWDDRKT